MTSSLAEGSGNLSSKFDKLTQDLFRMRQEKIDLERKITALEEKALGILADQAKKIGLEVEIS
jgi:BMFP domain-containing protein YqiC